MCRPRSRVVLAVLFALLALNAWGQVLLAVLGRSQDPPLLLGLQVVVGAAAAAAAIGSWQGARWAQAAALGYGVVAGLMILSLEPILDLGPESRSGLWVGAALLLALGGCSAWFLRRGPRDR